MNPFSRVNIVNAIISGLVGTLSMIWIQSCLPSSPSWAENNNTCTTNCLETVEEKESHILYRMGFIGPDGQRVGLYAFVLTQSYRWKYGSTQEIEEPSSEKVNSIQAYLEGYLAHRLQKATDVISIGMASCEGSREEEEERAGARAEMLNLWVQRAQSTKGVQNFYVVNLGQFRKHNCEDGQASPEQTSRQRRIVYLYTVQDPSRGYSEEVLAGKILEQLQANSGPLFDPSEYSRPFELKGKES